MVPLYTIKIEKIIFKIYQDTVFPDENPYILFANDTIIARSSSIITSYFSILGHFEKRVDETKKE